MNAKDREKSDWRDKIRSFSDNMFRNYQIVRKRWEISACEKKRSLEIARLGNLVFRLYKEKSLTDKKIEPQIQRLEKIDIELRVLEEALRDLIVKADVPRQLTAGASAEKKPATEKAGAPETTEAEPTKTGDTPLPEKKPVADKTKQKPADSDGQDKKTLETKRKTPLGPPEKKDVTKEPIKDKKTDESGSQETTITPVPGKTNKKESSKKEKSDTKPLEKDKTSQPKPAETDNKRKEKPELM